MLFSKKTFVCVRCRKEYTGRFKLSDYCEECSRELYDQHLDEEREKAQLNLQTIGYSSYRNIMFLKSLELEDMRKIIGRRNELVEKYSQTEGITAAELSKAGAEYKSLTEEQINDVIRRMGHSSIRCTLGAAYNSNFFALANYSCIIVDVQDVFAVGFTRSSIVTMGNEEVLLCAVFTNDPYVPVFPMVFVGKKGFFDVFKSKKGRENVSEIFTLMCPNLQYPVGELRELKNIIKKDGMVKGSIDMKFMLNQISNASMGTGIFEQKKLNTYFQQETRDMLEGMGYLLESDIDEYLKMNKSANAKFWNQQMTRVYGE